MTNAKFRDNRLIAKLTAVRNYLFLPRDILKRNYPFISKAPFLLPVAWALRWLRIFTPKRRKATKHLNEIASGSDEARKQYDLLVKLGLQK